MSTAAYESALWKAWDSRGSVFTVLLPATETARRPDIRTVSSPRTAQAGVGSILFVDDDAALRMIAQRALERHGYDVLLAENGREARYFRIRFRRSLAS